MRREAVGSALVLAALGALIGAACTSLLGDFTADELRASGSGASSSSSVGNQGGGGASSSSSAGNQGGGGASSSSSAGGGGGASSSSSAGGQGGGGGDDCPPGLGDCNGDGTCETSLTDNPANCGACGKSCEGGTCANSKCGPVVLASGQNSPIALTVDATAVYWTNEGDTAGSTGQVVTVPIDGSGGAHPLITFQPAPSYITRSGSTLYWVNRNNATVMRMNTTGMGLTTLVWGNNGGIPAGLAVGGTLLYWANEVTGTVQKIPIQGGSAVDVATTQQGPYAVAVDSAAAYVYWSERNATGTISRAPTNGGQPQVIVSMQDHPRSIALDATHVYWANEDGYISKAPLSGGTVTPLAMGVTPRNIALDASYVYWTDVGDDTVNKAAIAGGSYEMVADAQNQPRGIATDMTRLYWTTQDSIVKLVK